MLPGDHAPTEPAPGAVSEELGALSGVTSDVAWTYVGVVAAGATSLLLPAIAIRHVGVAAFGAYAIVVAATNLVAPVESALALTVTRSAARLRAEPADGSDTATERSMIIAAHRSYLAIAAFVVLATIAASIAGAAIVARVPVITRGEATRLILLTGGAMVVTMATAAHAGFLIGARRFRLIGLANSAGSLVTLGILLGTNVRSITRIAAAVACGIVLSRLILFLVARRAAPWLTVRGGPPRLDRRLLVRHTTPLILIGLSGQLLVTTDVFVVGALAGAAAAGVYRAMSNAPIQAIGVIFRGYDATFPALAGTGGSRQEDAVRALTRVVACVTGGVMGSLLLSRHEVAVLLLGRPSVVGERVLAVFCALWAINALVHGLALVLIARAKQHVLAPIVVVEVIVNTVLTFALVHRLGAVGAAWASLIVVALSNLLVFPAVTRREFAIASWRVVLVDGLLLLLGGLAIAAVATAVARQLASGTPRVVVTAGIALALLAGGVPVALGPSGRKLFRSVTR